MRQSNSGKPTPTEHYYEVDNTQDLIEAVRNVQQTGGRIHIRGGEYTIDHCLRFNFRSSKLPPKGVAITGDGPGITKLVWRGTDRRCDGILILGDTRTPFSLRSLSLLKDAEGGGIAFRVHNPDPTGPNHVDDDDPRLSEKPKDQIVDCRSKIRRARGWAGSVHTIHDIVIGGYNREGAKQWDKGIVLVFGREVKISNFVMYGSIAKRLWSGIETRGSTASTFNAQG